MDKVDCIREYEKVREIILLETDRNKKGDLFNRLIYDVFHALGFGEPRFNVPKAGREIDLVLQHRTENRVALAECKAQSDLVGGTDVNKFVGALDVERGKYEQDGSSVVGYFISRSGFKPTVYEQEEERIRARKGRNDKLEMILLGPDGIVRELMRGRVLCSLGQAASSVRSLKEELYLCEQVDLLAIEEGWVWVLYYARFPKQEPTHVAFVHADGNQLLNNIADTLLKRVRLQELPFSNLTYIEAKSEKSFDKKSAQEAYFQYLKNELGEIQFEGMPADKEAGAVKVDLENIFVPLQFYLNDEEEEQGINENESIQIEEVLNRSLRAAILAKPGGGKSTLIRRIALAYAYPERRLRVDDGLPDRDWFPVYIRCRDLENNATKSIMEMIDMIVQRAEITKYAGGFKALVENALQDGRVLLLIDGLDEISNEKHRICFANQLRTFVATYPNVHLVITSREAGFRAVAGTIATYCKQYSISGFEEEQIRLLSLKWHQAILGDSRQVEEDSARLCDMILRDVRIVVLAENPLLLTTLLFVKRCVGYLPTKRCRLYEEMIKLLLVTWNAVAHDKLDMDETEPQLAFVAYCMMEDGQQKITRDELERCIRRARKELPEILDYTTVSPSKFIEQVEERSSLLIQMGYEENNRGQLTASYEFSHLSFQEYLAAKAIVKQWAPDSHNINLRNTLVPHLQEEHWREVIPLAAFLSGRDAQSFIEYLIECNKECLEIDEKQKMGSYDIITLHLANCIANEVPMNQKLLKESILLILKRKNALDKIRINHDSVDSVLVFDTISKSKYGSSYREIVKHELFNQYEDKYAFQFSDAWFRLFLLEDEESLHAKNILSLMESGDHQQEVTGALLMMYGAFQVSNRRGNEGLKYSASGCMKEIFSAVSQMLKSGDDLSVFSASWCVAWAGYGEADLIPVEMAADLADCLVELWIRDLPASLKRVVSWGLATVCMPGLNLRKRKKLCEVIEDNLKKPQNSHDRIAAIHIAIVADEWTKEEARQRIDDEMRQDYRIRKSRFLKKLKIITANQYRQNRQVSERQK
ncbi:NACHT domain-containing protein [bacterium C-53]|nr:NACHT domain-containing protein [Lachnospiraceae bacterium]NBI02334.1 NACHT domain-containing protein [Lachnospiraceae bacterium]RKJ11892.1 NACHT domain-containing protein [bacterium C-53]